MLWLEECVKEVLRRVDANDPQVEDCQNKSVFTHLSIYSPVSVICVLSRRSDTQAWSYYLM